MLLISTPLTAQSIPVAGPTNRLGFVQDAQDLQTAQNYVYREYLDNSIVPVIMTNVTCTGNQTPFQCVGDFPPGMQQGQHSIMLSAANIVAEGPKSNPFIFVFITNAPIPPDQIHIV